MIKIPLSAIKAAGYDAGTFQTAMEDYCRALEDHRFTKNGEPKPTPPHGWMEGLVRRVQYPVQTQKPDDFELDYEIEDDTPPPPTLKERKARLAVAVAQMERDAVEDILPPGKVRLLMMRANEAVSKPEDQRSAADAAAIAAFEQRQLACDAISRRAAEMMADIDDLTEATIDGWEPGAL